MEEKIMKKIEHFTGKLARRFAPVAKEKIVEISTNTRQEIIEDILKTAKTCAMVGICVAPLFCGKGSAGGTIFSEPDRAINIVYNEIHVVNNYKGGN